MRIALNSVFVGDQEHALSFYTDVLGFEKKVDLPAGEFRWLTVVSPEDPDGTQLLLEPNVNAAAAKFQKEMFEAGIPLTAFAVSNVTAEYERLSNRGVVFSMPPTPMGDTEIAAFDDTCGNLIQIYEE